MEYYYIAMLVFLAGLACFDLFVGVSNDAVNFLNSAMGSRIASFRTTMWVATFGVLLGATFSSGMMEVARSGIFHPQMFNFTEVMIIFFAVMIADIVLLDTFNSLGLPTSTTVSIVFELLGSAIAAAAIKLYWEGGSLQMVFDYINTSESLTIISAILISVVVAFISGAVVQYIMRLIFSFYFERVYPYVGGVFGVLDYLYYLVDVVHADNQTLDYVLARKRLFKFVLGPAQNNEALIVYVVGYYVQQSHKLRLAVCDSHHVYAESYLKLRVFKQRVYYLFRLAVLAQLYDGAHTLLVAFVHYFRYALKGFLLFVACWNLC